MELANPMFAPNEGNRSASELKIAAPEYRSTSAAHWVFLSFLGLAFGASICFGYLALKKKDIPIGQLFEDHGKLNALGQRVDTTEGRMHDLAGEWGAMAQRVARLESSQGKFGSDVRQTRKYAETLTERLGQQVAAEIETRTSVLDARLRQVESTQAAQQSQVAQLEGELRKEIASAKDDTGRNLSALQEQVEGNARDVSALSKRLDPERVDFELAKNRITEIAPGVSLNVTNMNNQYQRFSGYVWLLQDRRTVWLHNQSVHEPVRLYQKENGDPYELVVTDVAKHSVAGYLLVPSGSEVPDDAAAAKPAAD